ncbi:unnamed protein product [Rotaria sp. Silwood1]|nr:unnamed protein product [Rotaria sp. Silwood1]
MEQILYGISKFFKYNLILNQIEQTEQVQQFMIDQIKYNDISKKLYAIIHNNSNAQYLVEINTQTLQIYQIVQVVVRTKNFDYNICGFGYIKSVGLIALWQYSIITPMIFIKVNERSSKQIQNVTITPKWLFSYDLSFFIFILIIKTGSCLICYQCDEIVVTAMNLTTPSGCIKIDVNKTYCTIGIIFKHYGKGYINIASEIYHRAYGYNEDFVLLGLTIKAVGHMNMVLLIHCLTDDCNELKLSKLQLLLNSTTIEHNTDIILPLLYMSTPEIPLTCSRYTNFTNPNACCSQKQSCILCVACFTSINGITNSMCSDYFNNAEMISNLLDERAYILKTRKTSNHNFVAHCNIRKCNRIAFAMYPESFA